MPMGLRFLRPPNQKLCRSGRDMHSQIDEFPDSYDSHQGMDLSTAGSAHTSRPSAVSSVGRAP